MSFGSTPGFEIAAVTGGDFFLSKAAVFGSFFSSFGGLKTR
jgi:hypothetical protein